MERRLTPAYTIAIVCSSQHTYGSDFLEKYSDNGIYTCICIFNKKTRPRSKLKILQKISSIGIIGAFIGVALRKYYKHEHKNIQQVCERKNIPFYMVEDFKISDKLKGLFQQADLGVSMGNGYIPSSFYALFKKGMINIHHELLPEYAGAASVIWSLYDRKKTTGFTIHKINSKIDAGDILYKQEMPIIFKNSLGETIQETYRQLKNESIDKLHLVLMRLKEHLEGAYKNNVQRSYTTPSLWQFLIIFKNFNKLKKE